VTIRVLGGLLSAYHLSSGDSLYLDRAIELADRMLPVFETPSGLPFSMVNLGLRKGVDEPDSPGIVSTAEAATLQLELRYLSFLTENDEYWDRAEKVFPFVVLGAMLLSLLTGHENHQSREDTFGFSSNISWVSRYPWKHMATSPMIYVVRAESGQFLMSTIRLGSRGDSYYEYLLYVFRMCFDLFS
jgi:mannosyl-oligosaccharide alpha-1,2-mannosidase